MKLLRIVRTCNLKTGANDITKDLFEFKESKKHFLIFRPSECSNKQLPKDSIMNPKCELQFGVNSTELFAILWCFDYQEKEAEEMLEEHIQESFLKKVEALERNLASLKLLKNKLSNTQLTELKSEQ